MAQLAFGAVVVGAVVVKALCTDEHPDDKVDNEKSVCSGRDQAEISYSDMSTHRVHRIADEHKRTEDLIVYVGKGKWKGRNPSIADKRDPKKSQRWWISADKGRRKYAHKISAGTTYRTCPIETTRLPGRTSTYWTTRRPGRGTQRKGCTICCTTVSAKSRPSIGPRMRKPATGMRMTTSMCSWVQWMVERSTASFNNISLLNADADVCM